VSDPRPWRARVLAIGGAVAGAGVLIDRRHVLTCAHVVNQALGRDRGVQERPDGLVEVDFVEAQAWPLDAQVAAGAWVPIRSGGGGDVAVLELPVDAPPGAKPAWLRRPPRLTGHRFDTYGYPSLLPKAATEQTSSGLSPFLSRDGVGDENSRVGVEEGRVWIEAAKLREATEPLVRDLQATLAWDQARARSEVDWWLRLAVDGLGLRFGRAIRSSRLTTRSSSRPWWSEPLKPSRSGRMRRSSIRRGRRASATGAIRCRLARPTTAALRGAAPRTKPAQR
jgi:hypothetical protein